MYEVMRERLRQIVEERGLGTEDVRVSARALSPEEAIGNPEDDDYPLVKGRERLMQAEFRDAVGQAFTDMFGNYVGKMRDVMAMELVNNYRRAIFIATLNAVMRQLGYVSRSIHCKDDGPRKCASDLVSFMETEYGEPKIALVGLQPRMAEALAARFRLRVTDLDQENIGTEKFGVFIAGPEKTRENLEWCDIALVTGTTAVNNTIGEFLLDKPIVFYGATVAGVAPILGLKHFCREST